MTELTRPDNDPRERFLAAMRLAAELHHGQTKKTGAPYISHLFKVCALVLRAGGDEDQAIAALLHDAPEKSGGRPTLDRIATLFGHRVATIVKDCTDSYDGDAKPDWLALKQQQVERFRATAILASALVYSADKLSNAGEIQRRLKIEGPTVWSDYGGGREAHLWYLRAMYEAFRELDANNQLLPELQSLLEQIAAFAS